MRKLLLFLAAALITAGFQIAKANPLKTYVSITEISFDNNTGMVRVVVQMPNPCTISPQPELVVSPIEQGVLVLNMIGFQTSDLCIQMLGGIYEIKFNIRQLKGSLYDLNIDPNGTYKIVTANNEFEMVFDFSQAVFTQPDSTFEVVSGSLAVENDRFFMNITH